MNKQIITISELGKKMAFVKGDRNINTKNL